LHGLDGIITPVRASWGHHVYHVYAIRVTNRDEAVKSLADQGIGTGIHYPVPVHLQEAYQGLGYHCGAFPIAERCAAEFLSLPMYPELTHYQVEQVIQGVKETVARAVEV
jgi:dTDP-4-amino-4,6-dideoxygalactose transaminase